MLCYWRTNVRIHRGRPPPNRVGFSILSLQLRDGLHVVTNHGKCGWGTGLVNAGEWVGSRWSSVLFHCLTIIGGIAMCSISGLLRSCALWSALLLLSLAAFAQKPCGVSVNLIPAGKDTIQVQGGLVERCIYRVELLNSRNDVFSVRFDVISTGTTIWAVQMGGSYTNAWGFSSMWGYFAAPGPTGYPAQPSAYLIGTLYVSGPPT
ncbi:MAG: hypothetical protein ACPLRO_09555, partial [Candidatus Kapaibacteriota bacterium]